eukprot:1158517-Pelagomonas_calceolata.AAC.10
MQLRSVEVSHCTSMTELLLPALAPAAAALVSGGYAAEAAHGVVVHGLRGPMEVRGTGACVLGNRCDSSGILGWRGANDQGALLAQDESLNYLPSRRTDALVGE